VTPHRGNSEIHSRTLSARPDHRSGRPAARNPRAIAAARDQVAPTPDPR